MLLDMVAIHPLETNTHCRTLETKRLSLRPIDLNSEADLQAIIKVYNDPFIGPWGFYACEIDAPQKVINKCRADAPLPQDCTLLPPNVSPPPILHLVYLKSSGESIGMVGISFRKDFPFPDLGYAIFGPFGGHGYGSEAAKACSQFWEHEIGIKNIIIITVDSNTRSQRCARRIGFEEKGMITIRFRNGTSRNARAFGVPALQWPEGDLTMTPVG